MSLSSSVQELAYQLGLRTNEHGGQYVNVVSFNAEKKIAVIKHYEELKRQNENIPPSINMVSKKAQVSWRAADKIIHQYLSDSLTPSNVQTCEEFTPKGPGSKTLSIDDETCLLYLYFENPYRPLTSYVRELFNMTSTLANEKTLSKWFLKSLPHRMGIKKGTIAPIDKFTPENAL